MDRMSSWNTVPMRPLTTPKPFNAWGVAALAYVIGTAVTLVLGFVLGTLGFLVMSGMALTDEAGGPSRDDIISVTLLVAILIGVVSLLVEAWFIHRRGGARPFIAPFVARAGSLLVGWAVTPLALDDAPLTVLGIGVEIVVLALLIRTKTGYRLR